MYNNESKLDFKLTKKLSMGQVTDINIAWVEHSNFKDTAIKRKIYKKCRFARISLISKSTKF